MTEKEISKDNARKILQEYLVKAVKHLVKAVEITEQEPNFPIYKTLPEDRVWYAYIPNTTFPFYVGGSRIIMISKDTGRIHFDGIVGD